ncbi:MAG: minor capsid protein [Clostridiales bacterium]|nr:minor capsid protein [Clostridiales bacterium]
MKTSNYWDKRALKRLTEAEKHSEEYINRVKDIYDQAFRDIDKELASIYKNYSKETGIDTQKLKELLTRSETKKTWEQMKRQGLDKYVLNNYKSRISRLEQLQAQIYAKAKMIYPKEDLQNTMCYKGVINDSYYKTMYDTQMGTGYEFNFSTIDNNMVNALLNERWSGKNYSQRIWDNTDILANNLSQILGGAMLSGQSIERTAKQMRDRFGVSKYYAERLIRTETNHFNNEADAMAYEELGLDKYVFVATLDSRTSEICQVMDNKVFEFSEREEGVNYPPLHPNCRSKTRAYLGKEEEKTLQRRARNPFTGETELIPNMSYEEWAKKYNDNTLKINNNGIWSFNSVRDKGIKDNFKKAHNIIKLDIKENKNIYNNIGKLDIKVYNNGRYSPHYSPQTNGVYLPNKVNDRNSGTGIHEVGHAVDFGLGKKLKVGQLSKSGNLTTLIDEYYNDNKAVLPQALKDYQDSINKRVSKLTGAVSDYDISYQRYLLAQKNYRYDAPNRLCDMFSSLTKGKANNELFGSHSQAYWRQNGMRETELYAQFTYLKMTNSKKELKVLEKTVPKVYNELDRLYTKASKELRRL